MAYEKPFLTTSDHAVGLQCVNRALENNRALLQDQFDPGHSLGLGGAARGDPFLSPGRHDDPLVSRSVALFSMDVGALDTVAVTLISGPLIFSGARRVAQGEFQIFLTTQEIVSAYALINGPSTGVARHATCLVSNNTNAPYVTVSTWNVAGGAKADYDFSLVLYAEGV